MPTISNSDCSTNTNVLVHRIVESLERFTLVYTEQLPGSTAAVFFANGLIFQAKTVRSFIGFLLCHIMHALHKYAYSMQVIVGEVAGVSFNPNATEGVPGSGTVRIDIPKEVFNTKENGTEVNIVFTLYSSLALFPYNATDNVTVHRPVVGATISTFNTSNLPENITVTFLLETTVSLLLHTKCFVTNIIFIASILFVFRTRCLNVSPMTVSIIVSYSNFLTHSQ